MTDKLIEMAKQVGAKEKLSVMRPNMNGHQMMLLAGLDFTHSELEAFANLIRADEREQLAQEAEKNGNDVLAYQLRARGE